MEREVVGRIYGVRLEDSVEYRYVGLTEAPIARRFGRHKANARAGRKTPFYDWLRAHERDHTVVDCLEVVMTTREDLGAAEVKWVADLRADGHRLLNLTDGGIGPSGVVWSEEQREAARKRATGRRGVSRFGEDNPFFGRSHSPEQREKWSKVRKGTNSGPDNPNFGKFGPEHPSYGRVMTDEQRRALSQARRGAGNPNYGKSASAETRAKMSAIRKGRPMPSSWRSAHTRHHTNMGRTSPTCQYCQEDLAGNKREETS